uniref:Uncharacterized protein n=1 Tax=Arundo donax TaxID=35708 RepID=A0A0A9GIS3_ARUDO
MSIRENGSNSQRGHLASQIFGGWRSSDTAPDTVLLPGYFVSTLVEASNCGTNISKCTLRVSLTLFFWKEGMLLE